MLTSNGGDVIEGDRYWFCDIENVSTALLSGRNSSSTKMNYSPGSICESELIGICEGGKGNFEARCSKSVKVEVGDSEV